MMPLSVRRARQLTLLLFVVILAITVATLVGAGRASSTTLQPTVDPETSGFTVSAADLGAFGDAPPVISSPSAYVVNMNTGKVLYEQSAHTRRPMASTTKMMTAILVLENMDLDSQLTASDRAARVWELESWLKAGDVLTVKQLLYALMVMSANQAAVVLGEGYPGGEQAFVDLMNSKAAELGMNDTHYVNPHGLDSEGHYSTAADLVTLARYAMGNETFRELSQTKEYTTQIQGHDKPTTFITTNELLPLYDWVIGVKTGETPKALTCLVAAGVRDGVSVLSAVLGQPIHEVCFEESKTLLEYGLSQYRYVTLLDEGAAVAEAAVPYHLDKKLQLVPASPVGIGLYKDQSVTVSVVVDRPLVLPVTAGEAFGRIDLTVEGAVVDTIDLIASESFSDTTLGTKIAYYFTRLGR
jgi:D-alanyl-D-alanine carboxypeptidase (penicillin-binding protein 5/6)